MAVGVFPTESDLKIARDGLLLSLEASTQCEDVESFIVENILTDFIENQVRVKAANEAYSRMQSNVINRGLK